MSKPCFHCGLPTPADDAWPVSFADERHPTCCPGCQAVAQTIIDAGHGDYYRHRDRYATPGAGELPAILHDLELFDRPQIQREFVQARGADRREAALMLEGITCAACVWLNERHVRALDGVLEFHVNYSTHRARLVWAPSRIALSSVLAAIEAIGYRAHPYDPEREDRAQRAERNAALRRLAVGGLATMQVMMLALGLWLAEADGATDQHFMQFLRYMAALFALPVVTYVAWPFYRGAWRDLRTRRLGMDVPIAIATLTTYLASLYGTWLGTGEHVYFESAAMFVFFLTASRYLEMLARQRAARANQRLDRLLPAIATLVENDGALREVSRAELELGHTVRIPPGAAVPGDGILVRGTSELDCALLTGESEPQPVAVGDRVIAGTINRGQSIDVRIERLGAQTELAEIQRLVERAQATKPRITLMAERGTGAFITAVLLLTLVVGAVWWIYVAPDRALWVMVAMLVATCPCALALATPAAQTITAGQLARLGIVLMKPDRFPLAAKLTDVVFDKTGTLTIGRPSVVASEWSDDVTPDQSKRAAILALLARAESHADHVLARAVRAFAIDSSRRGRESEALDTGEIQSLGVGVAPINEQNSDPRRTPVLTGLDVSNVETIVGEGLEFTVRQNASHAIDDALDDARREGIQGSGSRGMAAEPHAELAGTWRIGRRGFALTTPNAATVDGLRDDFAQQDLPRHERAHSEVWVSRNGRAVLKLKLDDPLRSEAIVAVAKFLDAGVNVHLLSGDRPGVVAHTLEKLEGHQLAEPRESTLFDRMTDRRSPTQGSPGRPVDGAKSPMMGGRGRLVGHGDLRPGDKLERLRAIREARLDRDTSELFLTRSSPAGDDPERLAPPDSRASDHAVVMAVGDGVNDTPLLAAADLSVAMGSGTRIAQAEADIVLLNDRVDRLAQLPAHARRTDVIIRQNIAWAIGYNLLALPLAATGVLEPWMAALGMSVSSLIVVVNALRLHEDLDGHGLSSRNLLGTGSVRAVPSRQT